jgi:signal transduction histidine kinase/ActR/RegA family two-component response regulator
VPEAIDALLTAVTELSFARDLPSITATVRRAARHLTGADGVTFVLRDGDDCYYADEDAIAPLWKGRRFPMSACISGWVMRHRGSVAIDDIYQDPRIPHDAYRPTFVKSLLMVPVRIEDPIAAIGAYWARTHAPTDAQRNVLETLARAASLALTNVQLWTDVQRHLAGEQQARRDAEAATAAATAANQVKDQFLATVSHELRTPLNVMQGWLWQLRQPALPPDRQRQGLDTIERNIALQCRLVEDLLDASRALAGRLTLESRLVDLAGIARVVVDLAQASAVEKGVGLTLRQDRPDPLVIWGDGERLQQVVWNLVANALKFTSRGGEIEVAVGRSGSRASIAVRDTGVGIAPEFLPHVFAQFRQEDGTPARAFGGLGIGLTIVEQLVRLHSGTVTAESAGKDRGTVVRVDLPIPAILTEPGDWLRRRVGGQEPASADLTGLSILVIDDEIDAAIAVRAILEQRGASVQVAASADEAMAMTAGAMPDLVLADLAMPGTDGFGFLKRFRERHGATTDVPVAALSALSKADHAAATSEAGFESFLQKPVSPDELASTVARLARRPRRSVH